MNTPPRRKLHSQIPPWEGHTPDSRSTRLSPSGPFGEPNLGHPCLVSHPLPQWHSRLTLDTFFYKHVSVELCQLVSVGGEGRGSVEEQDPQIPSRHDPEGSGLESSQDQEEGIPPSSPGATES